MCLVSVFDRCVISISNPPKNFYTEKEIRKKGVALCLCTRANNNKGIIDVLYTFGSQ